MIAFHLDTHTGVPAYLQLVQQVKQALRLGLLTTGDQLPTVREVVEQVIINPNTVLKAYRELEREGLVASRPGQGTFIIQTLAATAPASLAALSRSLTRWLRGAHEAGLDDESILALFMTTFRAATWRTATIESEGTA
ncbi:MAG TPA: GntR family transcriptional regulator [Ktedonobacterales bacterium]|nr:GntR family transcriptional regulator [Ktedonobacterales bacterium]